MFPIFNTAQLIKVDMDYSIVMVILSILIAGIAAFVAIRLNTRIGQSSFLNAYIWSGLASVAMSLGIWSMHFIGMSAIQIHDEMHLNYIITFMSILPTVIACYIAFYLINKERATLRMYVFASVMMGTAITIMHYLGMAAMTYEHVVYEYNMYIVAGSVCLAILVSFIGLSTIAKFNQQAYVVGAQIFGALLLGVAVSTVHYLGVLAMTFYQDARTVRHTEMIIHEMESINLAVFFSMLLVLVIFWLAGLLDRYANYRLRHFDALTQLPNRHAFMKLIESKEKANSVAIISFDNLEFSTGEYDFLVDELVIGKIAVILKDRLPSMTLLYRLKERHFIFVAKDQRATNELVQSLTKKMGELKKGFQINGEDIKVQAVCLIDEVRDTALVRDLHANAFLVEQHPGTTYNFSIIYYDMNYHTRHFTDQLLNDLESSLERKELYLVYQPKISPYNGELESVEALIRWQHPMYGFLSPGVFIPILEAHNRINEVTDWIIEEICMQLQEWRGQSEMPCKISINIPGPYLTSNRLKTQLINMVKLYKVQPQQVELEITETSFVQSIEEARQAVDYFRTQHFEVALDDFGIGVSSLAYLKDFRFTTLKIDKSFMDYVPHSEKDCAIMKSILSLGKSLNMQVVAEGIEKEDQVDFLLSVSRDIIIQGYYYAKPMTVAELTIWCETELPKLKAEQERLNL